MTDLCVLYTYASQTYHAPDLNSHKPSIRSTCYLNHSIYLRPDTSEPPQSHSERLARTCPPPDISTHPLLSTTPNSFIANRSVTDQPQILQTTAHPIIHSQLPQHPPPSTVSQEQMPCLPHVNHRQSPFNILLPTNILTYTRKCR